MQGERTPFDESVVHCPYRLLTYLVSTGLNSASIVPSSLNPTIFNISLKLWPVYEPGTGRSAYQADSQPKIVMGYMKSEHGT